MLRRSAIGPRTEQPKPHGRPAIGLIAGWGRFPVLVAAALRNAGYRVDCVAIRGHALPEIASVCERVCWSGVGRMGSHLRFFRRGGVVAVTLAGKLFKADLLYRASVLRHTPDWTCIRTFAPLILGRRRDTRDDSLLLAVTQTYQSKGIPVVPATDYAPELLVNPGHFAGPPLSATRRRDAEHGWMVAKTMGEMDIGQAITVKDGTVLAVEAIEGTDACIERTGELCPRGGWTLVKVAKPEQDMRFDVPTIGPQTVARVRAAGGTCIVVEAKRTIIVDQDETFRDAERAGITLLALEPASGKDFQPITRP